MIACGHARQSPQQMYEQANRDFLQGYLSRSQNLSQQGYVAFFHSSPEWVWKFRILEAKAALWRGLYADVFQALNTLPDFADHPDLAIQKLTLLGIANVNTHNFAEAERMLTNAARLCDKFNDLNCGELLLARGLLASELGQSASAEQFYESSLAFARAHRDYFQEADALLNLGDEFLSRGLYDEAIDRSEEGYQLAKSADAKILQLVIQGNIGWAYYKLGDPEKALDLSLQSESQAAELGDIFAQENEITNVGYIYMDEGKLDLAAQSFQHALKLAEGIKAKEDIYNALRVLARLAVRSNDLDKARQYVEAALKNAQESGNHADELYPRLVQGQIAAGQGDSQTAQRVFKEIAADRTCPVSLKWEAQHSLARLYESQKQSNKADHEYQAALATFEAARSTVRHEDFQLSFLTNVAAIYDDYIHFLVNHGEAVEALRWADYSRARTLAEGLGLLPKSSVNGKPSGPPGLDLQDIARHANGTILFYWLGEKQSYLWAINDKKNALFPLPPATEINSMVERYRKDLLGPEDVLDASNDEGRRLFNMLIAPAQSFLKKNEKVVVIADGSLNNLNFETLVVAEPKPHYWIEDADVVNASSIRVLAASLDGGKSHSQKLLLIGDSISPNEDYPALPQAASQMASVEKSFPSAREIVYQGSRATPDAYLRGEPQQFSYIHFVAHGTASRLSPLDSAIVLSRENGNTESFKLYASDIITHPLKAQLVTISACYGAGDRSYKGEGLVGLAWAFLRAGAHNVVAALWDVSDASTNQLMGSFYGELAKSRPPDVALRDAKLSLIHSGGVFQKPFYWAPFQLYTGR
jgi:CHAT domain-containing protein